VDEPNIKCVDIRNQSLWLNGSLAPMQLEFKNEGTDTLHTGENFHIRVGYSGPEVVILPDMLVSVSSDIGVGSSFTYDCNFTPQYIGAYTITVDVDILNEVKEIGNEDNPNSLDFRYSKTFVIGDAYIGWRDPAEGTHIVFDMGIPVFNFAYDISSDIQDIWLKFNDEPIYDVTGLNSTTFTYNNKTDGNVNATLFGVVDGEIRSQQSREFIFGKIDYEYREIIEENTTYLGQELYLILHDPGGDNSYSSYTDESYNLTIGVEMELVNADHDSYGFSNGLGMMGFEFLGGGITWENNEDELEDMTHFMKITDSNHLTSSLENENSNYIGPGYGDSYWGVSEIIIWEFRCRNITYYNGTSVLAEPDINYGILADVEVIKNDEQAKQIWYDDTRTWWDMNPVHNNFSGVEWYNDLEVDGQLKRTSEHEITNTVKHGKTYEMQFSRDAQIRISGFDFFEKLPWVGDQYDRLEAYKHTKTMNSTESGETYKVFYEIYDDEAEDVINQKVGLDLTFGTYIFKKNVDFCNSSFPLEYEAQDYIPPIIEYDSILIEYDTSGDGLGPCSNDNPLVSADIFEEDEVQIAMIQYSIDNGQSFHPSFMNEHPNIDGRFLGNIPAQPHGKTILWYLEVVDESGYKSSQGDISGNFFEYVVENRNPTLSITYPNGNEILSGSVLIQWHAVDPDGDILFYDLFFIDEDGLWKSIVSNISRNDFLWDFSDIVEEKFVNLKIIAFDQFGGVSEDTCDTSFKIIPEDSTSTPLNLPLAIGGGLIGVVSLLGIGFIAIKKFKS
jgi:hypothetical protein